MSDQMLQLKKKIMRRIYVLFMVRNLAPLAFDITLLILFVFFISVIVSVHDVVLNFSTAASGSNALQFSVAAVSGTKIQTKLLLIALGVIGFFGVRHLRRAVQAVRTIRGKAGQNTTVHTIDHDTTI